MDSDFIADVLHVEACIKKMYLTTGINVNSSIQ